MLLESLSPSDFNPRSPWGERPLPRRCIHLDYSDFNPRSPWGERLIGLTGWKARQRFQSTLPVWGATCSGFYSSPNLSISIHAPRVGSDWTELDALQRTYISIHAPRVGSDKRVLWKEIP